MKQSAGILLYRNIKTFPEFFLVHPGGPFWKNKDDGSWSIPKGEFSTEEDALDAAKREFREETGFDLQGAFIPLTPVKQKSGKLVHAWALEKDVDADVVKSNLFEIEWPPRSGKIKSFPEIDKAGWFEAEEALRLINVSQAAFINELFSRLNL